MENLISMTDYVLEQKEVALENPNTIIALGRFLDNVTNYAKFLSMPLELKMFVPCDDEGNVLEKELFSPIWEDYHNKKGGNHELYLHNLKIYNEYQKALSEVIFEGFELKTRTAFNNGYEFVVDKNEIFYPYWRNPVLGWESSKGLRTVEDLIKFGIKLTPNAKLKYKF